MVIVATKNGIQEEVYSALKRAIMTLHYVPGTAMTTQAIATKLNVSRTPVREAFVRLQSEGLVETIPQRGTLVSRIDLKRVEQERFIRESLEVAIVDPFLARCSPEILARLRKLTDYQETLLQEKKYAEFVDSDYEWHSILFDVAEQTLAWKTMMTVNGHYNRIRILTAQVEEITASVVPQHRKIIELFEANQADQARTEIKKHVSKLKAEKYDLLRLFPDYFTDEESAHGVLLGEL